MRRVVVTGMGLVTPLGLGAERVWKKLLDGESGVGAIQSFDVSDLPARIAAQVPLGDKESGHFNADDWVPPKDQRRMDQFIIFAMAAAQMAVEDADWQPTDEEDLERTGCMIGSGIGGLPGITEGAITLQDKGPRRITPFFIPANLINLASGNVSIKYGFKGPNHAVVTACSTGAHAIGDAARIIMLDDADVMVCGGAEAAVCRLGLAGFAAARALSTNFNEDPPKASRPWDQDRDGFVMGEGAGILVLEELGHARARGAAIYAEVLGYAATADAHHITDPAPGGAGLARALRRALRKAAVVPERVGYINAHGTSTLPNDRNETVAIKAVFVDHARRLAVSSTKSMTGHLMGAAGGVEIAVTALALRDGVLPPTINYDEPDPDCDLDYVPNCARSTPIEVALSNSMGFGGHNAVVVLGRPD